MGPPDCLASWDRSITLIYSSNVGLRHAAQTACRNRLLVDQLEIMSGLRLWMGEDDSFVKPMAAFYERLGQARSRLAAGHRRRRLGLDGARPALDCSLAERSVVPP